MARLGRARPQTTRFLTRPSRDDFPPELSAFDSGTGSDAYADLAAVLDTRTDSGAGTDTAALAASYTSTESGVGTESAALTVAYTATESGAGTDTLAALAAAYTVTDSGAGTDDNAVVTTVVPVFDLLEQIGQERSNAQVWLAGNYSTGGEYLPAPWHTEPPVELRAGLWPDPSPQQDRIIQPVWHTPEHAQAPPIIPAILPLDASLLGDLWHDHSNQQARSIYPVWFELDQLRADWPRPHTMPAGAPTITFDTNRAPTYAWVWPSGSGPGTYANIWYYYKLSNNTSIGWSVYDWVAWPNTPSYTMPSQDARLTTWKGMVEVYQGIGGSPAYKDPAIQKGRIDAGYGSELTTINACAGYLSAETWVERWLYLPSYTELSLQEARSTYPVWFQPDTESDCIGYYGIPAGAPTGFDSGTGTDAVVTLDNLTDTATDSGTGTDTATLDTGFNPVWFVTFDDSGQQDRPLQPRWYAPELEEQAPAYKFTAPATNLSVDITRAYTNFLVSWDWPVGLGPDDKANVWIRYSYHNGGSDSGWFIQTAEPPSPGYQNPTRATSDQFNSLSARHPLVRVMVQVYRGKTPAGTEAFRNDPVILAAMQAVSDGWGSGDTYGYPSLLYTFDLSILHLGQQDTSLQEAKSTYPRWFAPEASQDCDPAYSYQSIVAADAGTGTDTATLDAAITSSDSGTGSDIVAGAFDPAMLPQQPIEPLPSTQPFWHQPELEQQAGPLPPGTRLYAWWRAGGNTSDYKVGAHITQDAGWAGADASFLPAGPAYPDWPGATQASITSTWATAPSDNYDDADYNWVTLPLDGAQRIAGFIRGVMYGNTATGTGSARPQLIAKVVSGDGNTLRGYLTGFYVGAESELFIEGAGGGSNKSIRFPNARLGALVELTPVDAQDGDRIVLEIGHRALTSGTQGTTTTAWRGDADQPDATGAGDSSNNTWFEFSQLLKFRDEPGTPGGNPFGSAGTLIPPQDRDQQQSNYPRWYQPDNWFGPVATPPATIYNENYDTTKPLITIYTWSDPGTSPYYPSGSSALDHIEFWHHPGPMHVLATINWSPDNGEWVKDADIPAGVQTYTHYWGKEADYTGGSTSLYVPTARVPVNVEGLRGAPYHSDSSRNRFQPALSDYGDRQQLTSRQPRWYQPGLEHASVPQSHITQATVPQQAPLWIEQPGQERSLEARWYQPGLEVQHGTLQSWLFWTAAGPPPVSAGGGILIDAESGDLFLNLDGTLILRAG